MVQSRPTPNLAARIGRILRLGGVNAPHIANVLAIALASPMQDARLITGPKSAQEVVSTLTPQYRAAFIAHSARRVAERVKAGGTLATALETERRYFQQHQIAMKKRVAAATAIDKIAGSTRRKVGWYATLDSRTSPECRAAHGKNFFADRMPSIGYPGAVHPSCRCKPGKPHATKDQVYAVKARDAA